MAVDLRTLRAADSLLLFISTPSLRTKARERLFVGSNVYPFSNATLLFRSAHLPRAAAFTHPHHKRSCMQFRTVFCHWHEKKAVYSLDFAPSSPSEKGEGQKTAKETAPGAHSDGQSPNHTWDIFVQRYSHFHSPTYVRTDGTKGTRLVTAGADRIVRVRSP